MGFFTLLRESGIAQEGAVWKEAGTFMTCRLITLMTFCIQVKKTISDEARTNLRMMSMTSIHRHVGAR
jgi:hypothetical protein